MLPAVDPATGQLPPGRHTATWSELKQAFVTSAPNPVERAQTFQALVAWAAACRRLLPGAKFWIDGGFVTHKASAPFDVDVVAVVPMAELKHVFDLISLEGAARASTPAGTPTPKCPTEVRFWGLWTLLGVTADQPKGRAPRVQPYGGHIDAFFIVEENTAAKATWHSYWSMGNAHGPKGYLEVTA